MNNIFDTHAHYDDDKFNDDRDLLLSSLPEKGIDKIVSCGCDAASTEFNRQLSRKYDFIYYASGLHPENIDNAKLSDIDKIEQLALDKKCVAIGEIGLDYYWMNVDKKTQIDFFERQIQLADRLNLPIIVHDRDAHGDTLNILKNTEPKGVLHCFSGSKEMAREIIKIGMYIGLNGVATFKNARKSLEVVKEIPLERLVLETDCPYLAPEPHRGKRNDSSYIPFIAKRIAEVLDIDAQEVLDITNKNAKRLYGIE